MRAVIAEYEKHRGDYVAAYNAMAARAFAPRARVECEGAASIVEKFAILSKEARVAFFEATAVGAGEEVIALGTAEQCRQALDAGATQAFARPLRSRHCRQIFRLPGEDEEDPILDVWELEMLDVRGTTRRPCDLAPGRTLLTFLPSLALKKSRNLLRLLEYYANVLPLLAICVESREEMATWDLPFLLSDVSLGFCGKYVGVRKDGPNFGIFWLDADRTILRYHHHYHQGEDDVDHDLLEAAYLTTATCSGRAVAALSAARYVNLFSPSFIERCVQTEDGLKQKARQHARTTLHIKGYDTIDSEADRAAFALVVEDSTPSADYMVRRVLWLGHAVAYAKNGQAAWTLLEMSKKTRVNLVISDIYMPKMDGMKLLHKIKNCPNLKHLAVVIITGLDPHDNDGGKKSIHRTCKVIGASAVLKKPCDSSVLRHTIQQALLQSP
ncbi:hypothetical protein CTAYLR_006175 [Chrysophaeum taylorii]|uniref:Response regulatory domain-containing protein n=1 Tax=Chrysophaeum taylorii TaxID=2483200 RepID=A0AAD7UMM3_9STRA|nr:hypothetical protein CTAYLR_006175 [Chrysophaeum taylorii]